MREGLSPSFFWSLSVGEVQDVLSGIHKKQESELKLRVSTMQVQAQQIAEYYAKTKDVKNEIHLRNIWDYYPQLFAEEKQSFIKIQEEKELGEYKQKRLEYAMQFNAKFGGGV